MALLDAMAKSAAALGLDLVAHGVNHGLRPAAQLELDRAEAHAATLGIPFSRTTLALDPGANLQHRARMARYRALREAAAALSASVIATAHHAEDRAETVLLRLLRGAGPRGLAVLPARSGDLIRPLIRTTKAQILAHLARHRVPYSEDPSNRDARFLRVRVRREVLPLLKELSPTVVAHLNALADQLTHPVIALLSEDAHLGVTLNRAQLGGVERASRLRQSDARIRVAGGKELAVDRDSGRLYLID